MRPTYCQSSLVFGTPKAQDFEANADTMQICDA